MTYRLRIRSRARDDIRAARDWYETQVPGLGSRFGEELDTVMAAVRAQPQMYAKVSGEIRRAMTRRFPYAIYFIVDDERISVLRVLHQARDPREWRGTT